MYRSLVFIVALTLGGTHAIAGGPIAEVLCEPTNTLYSKLKRQMQSTRTATGLRGPEQIMEVWTDPRGNWTMVVSYATGTSCIVAMGEDWVAAGRQDPA